MDIDARMVDFPSKLKQLRTEKQLGIKSLARRLGISYTYISHIEHGKSKPSEEPGWRPIFR
jgi:transcriptional regulator with XRE-family HTH domain